MAETTFDPLRVVAGLRARGVNYVLVGDLAAMAHGSAAVANRIEICVADDGPDIDRLGMVLDSIGAEATDDTGDPHRVAFDSSAGRVECIEMSRDGGYAELEARSIEVDLGNGVLARIAAPADVTGQHLASEDIVGAVRAAVLAADSGETLESKQDGDEFGPDRPVTPEGVRMTPWRRVWKAFEDVDTFLTDLNEGGLSHARERRR